MHNLHDEKQVIFNVDFARENLPAPRFEPPTFRPTTSSLQLHLPKIFFRPPPGKPDTVGPLLVASTLGT